MVGELYSGRYRIDGNPNREVVKDGPDVCFLLFEILLNLLPFGDINDYPDYSFNFSILIKEGCLFKDDIM